MKKLVVLLVVIGLISTLLAPAIHASSPQQPVVFSGAWFGQQNIVVEEQSDQHWPADPLRYNPDWLHYVVNPYVSCKWNGDDNTELFQISRYVKAGQTAQGDYCRVAQSNSNYVCINDNCQQWSFSEGQAIGFKVYSKSSNLIVKLTWMPQNKVFTLLPTWESSSKLYRYGGICVGINYLKDDLALQYIPGSNGSNDPASVEGRGVKTTITPSITNPTSRDIKDISYALTALGSSQPSGDSVCVNGPPAYTTHNTEYPFKWYTT